MQHTKSFSVFILTLFLFAPLSTYAATKFEISGWIPYWRTATGTADVLPHLNTLTEVNPFVYTIKSDGTLLDNGKLDQEPWASFIAEAKRQKVRVIPTIMTSNGSLLHDILSNTKKRQAFATMIAKTVKEKGYDGIDIDFEGKRAEDKQYFATFLKGLYAKMGNKWVMCTIESRTPLDSRYYGTVVPPDATVYANDFVAINKYCDRVRIMAYDQQGVDLKLTAKAASSSELYAPLADPLWVEKVVNLAAKDIKRSKIMIGVPTYGYEYAVTAYANNEYMYDIMWAFNPGYGAQIATQYGVTPMRNATGEMFLTYISTSTASTTAPISSVPYGSMAAATAAAVSVSNTATQNNSHQSFRMLEWSDAQSIKVKIDLAKKLGVRGISIFKLDGGQDPNLWGVLAGVKKWYGGDD